MKIKTIATMLSVGLLASASVNANTVSTLAALESGGGSLTIGDKTFSDFTYTESGLTSFDAADITVTASISGGIYYLTWGGNISLADFTGTATGDLLLGYTVTAAYPNTISEIDQNYTGGVALGVGGISIAETVTAPGSSAIIGSTYLNIANTSEPSINLNSSEPFIIPPQPVLDVTKDISLGVFDGEVSVSQIQQSFHQNTSIPDGGLTVAMLGSAMFGLAAIRSKFGKQA